MEQKMQRYILDKAVPIQPDTAPRDVTGPLEGKTSSNRIGFSPSLSFQTLTLPAWLTALYPAPSERWLDEKVENGAFQGRALTCVDTSHVNQQTCYVSLFAAACHNKAKLLKLHSTPSKNVPLPFCTSTRDISKHICDTEPLPSLLLGK